MIRHPPTSPLFPYTPLSRSTRAGKEDECVHALDIEPEPGGHLLVVNAGPDDGARARLFLEPPERSRQKEAEDDDAHAIAGRSEEHTSELQSLAYLVCRLLLE